MKSYISSSIEETEKIAHNWLEKTARANCNSEKAFVVGLSGHLGAGKTAYVKAVAKALGIKEEVTSPTFVIMKFYEIPINNPPQTHSSKSTKPESISWPWKQLVHIDAYRLEKKEELEALGFERLTMDPSKLIMIEWPENVSSDKLAGITILKMEIRDGLRVFTT